MMWTSLIQQLYKYTVYVSKCKMRKCFVINCYDVRNWVVFLFSLLVRCCLLCSKITNVMVVSAVFLVKFYVNRRGNQSHLGWDRPGSVFCPLSVNRWRCQRHRRGLGWAGISLPPFFHFFVSQPAGENVWIWSWYQLDCQPCHDRVRVINRKSFSRMDECNQTIQPLSTLSRSLVVCTAWLLLTGVCGVTSSICIFGQDQFSNPLK